MKIDKCVRESMEKKKGMRCDAHWKTKVSGNKVRVQHYDTDLLEINVNTKRVKRAVGFESQSDKRAVSKILDEIGVYKGEVHEVNAEIGHRF